MSNNLKNISVKIYIKKSWLHLVLSAAWIILGVASVLWHKEFNMVIGGNFLLGFAHIIIWQINSIISYVSIEKGIIKKKFFFGPKKNMDLNNISKISHIAGDYILYSPKSKLTIAPHLISTEDLIALKEIFEELEISIASSSEVEVYS